MTELEFINLLQSISETAWSVLIRQAYMEAANKGLFAALFLVVAWVAHFKRKENEILVPLSILCGVLAFYLFVNAAMWAINPEFYAIRFLLDRIGH